VAGFELCGREAHGAGGQVPEACGIAAGQAIFVSWVEKLLPRRIEPLVHFPRCLKERDGFLFDQHNGAGARVAAGMGSPLAPRKYPEAAEFNAVSSAQRRVDRAQDRVDETLDITLVETRILRGDAVDKLGFDHRVARTRL
jgi:hypothetical protein